MNQSDFYLFFDECVARIQQGATLDDCLLAYPELVEELAPVLTSVIELTQLSVLEPSTEIVSQGFSDMMSAFDAQTPDHTMGYWALVKNWFSQWRLNRHMKRSTRIAFQAVTLILMLLFVGGGLVVSASANSLPGQTLYQVKRSWEDTRLNLTFDDTSRDQLQSEFNEERQEEVKSLLLLRQPEMVAFEGIITAIYDDSLSVDDLLVFVTEETAVIGSLAVGQPVHVSAQVQEDGSLTALRIVVGYDTHMPTATQPVRLTPTPMLMHTARATFTPTSTVPEPMPTNDHPTRWATATRTPIAVQSSTPTPTKTPWVFPTPTKPSNDATPTPYVTYTPPPNDATPTPYVTYTPPPNDATPTPYVTYTPPPNDATPTPYVTYTPPPNASPTPYVTYTPPPNASPTPYVTYTPPPNASPTPYPTYTPPPSNEASPTPYPTYTPPANDILPTPNT